MGLDRIDKVGALISELDVPIVMIDHHIDPEPFYDWGISEPSASSTAELVYRFIEEAGYAHRMNQDIANCLYTGLITDTGSFKHATTVQAYRVASELKAIGIEDQWIQNRIFDTMSEKQIRLLGHCLANRMEVLADLSTGIIHLTREDYQTFDILRGDTEGIVNYILKMPGIRVAAFITEQPKIVKMSLRSKGDISVQKIASEHFNGGGHFNAAGGHSYQPLSTVIRHFKKILPNYILS